MLQVTADRSAICAGAKPSAPHQATITASLTDGWNHPVMGKNIAFSANHEFKNTGPSLNPTNGTTDANGNVQTTLTSGDGAVPGLVKANCEGIEGTVPVSFEAAEMFFEFRDTTGEREPPNPLYADGETQIMVRMTQSQGGTLVTGHAIQWRFRFTNASDGSDDYDYGTGEDPYGHIGPVETDAQGRSYVIYTVGTVGGIVDFRAEDTSVFLP